MHIPKSSYTRKPTLHGPETVKDVILDDSHLPGLLQFAKSYFRRGQILISHSHETMSEVFHIVSGSAKVIEDENSYIVNMGDSFYIKAKVNHSFEFLEDTVMIYFNLEDSGYVSGEV